MARPPLAAVDWPRIESAKLSDAVADVLERQIASSAMPSGSRLPAERDLAATMGVSRSSVREAIHTLELKGLVERRPGHGTVVTDSAAGRTEHTFLEHLSAEDRDLLEIMDFRLAIEPPLAQLAAERCTGSDLTRLRNLLERMEREPRPAQAAALDQEFHSAIAIATQNRLLARLGANIADWSRSSRRVALQGERRRVASLAGHQRIYLMITSRDPTGAAEAMLEHLKGVRRIIHPDKYESSHQQRGDNVSK